MPPNRRGPAWIGWAIDIRQLDDSTALQRLAGTLVGATVGAVLSYVLPPGPLAIGFSILAAMLLSYVLHLPAAAKLSGYVCRIVVLAHGAHPWS